MAPRETIAVSTNSSFLSGGATTAAQREALLKPKPAPYAPPPSASSGPVPVVSGESASSMKGASPSAQAATMKAAAEKGQPFCEVCAKPKPSSASAPSSSPSSSPSPSSAPSSTPATAKSAPSTAPAPTPTAKGPATNGAPKPAETAPAPAKPEPKKDVPDRHFQFRLTNDLGEYVGDARYSLKLPDGSVREGKTGPGGHIKEPVGALEGNVELTFPDLEILY